MEEGIQNNRTIGNNRKRFLRNIIIVLLSNVFSILSGILIAFVIPKIMEIPEYGYYKTFTLYVSYVGILHFGFTDGIYLKYAGKSFEELDQKKFRTYTRFLIAMQLSIMMLFLMISLAFVSTNMFLVLVFVSINLFAINMVAYFEIMSQITMKFKQTSIRKIIKCILNILNVLVLYILYRFNSLMVYGYLYIICVVAIDYLLALWYFITYRKLIFGRGSGLKEERGEILGFFKIGFPLLVSNLVGQFIFLSDQQVVNIFFDSSTYAAYAFAYNMINLVTVATNAISIVLYPTMKNMSKANLKENYSVLNSYLLIFVAFCLIAYFPLDVIVNGFIDKYSSSLPIFIIILPGVMISSSITVVKYNYYKVFNDVKDYLIKSVFILALSVIANIIVYYIFKTTLAISIVSIFVLMTWYLLIEIRFVRKLNSKWFVNLLYLVSMITLFYLFALNFNPYLAGIYYLFIFGIVTLGLYSNTYHGLNRKSIKY